MAYLILKERRLSVLFIKLKLLCLVGFDFILHTQYRQSQV